MATPGLEDSIQRALEAARLATESAEDHDTTLRAAREAEARAHKGQSLAAGFAAGAALVALLAAGGGALVWMRTAGDLATTREALSVALAQVAGRVESLDATAVSLVTSAQALDRVETLLAGLETRMDDRMASALAAMQALQPQIAESVRRDLAEVIAPLAVGAVGAAGAEGVPPVDFVAEFGALTGELRRLQAMLEQRSARAAPTEPAPRPAPSPRAPRPAQPPAPDPFRYP